MPIYEYVCERCGKVNDVLQKMNDPPPERCNNCGAQGTLTKVVSRSSFVLRGGGWYSDLYSSPKKDASTQGAKDKDGAPKKGDGAPSTPAAKPESTSDSASSGSPSKDASKK